MASEVVPDILNGLVAAGTLALAGATVYVGRIAVRAAVDSAAPRTVVVRLEGQEQPVNWPVSRDAEPGKIRPGTRWSLRQSGLDRIGLQAVGCLRNEGMATALFRFDHGADVEVGAVTREVQVPPAGTTLTQAVTKQEDWYVLGPGDDANFVLTWWRAASDWAASFDQRAEPVTTAGFVVRGVSGQARDHCDLTFGGYVLAPHPHDDGWVIALVNNMLAEIPGTVRPRTARIGLMRRTYANPFRRAGRDGQRESTRQR